MSSIYQSRKLYGYLGMSAQDVPITNKSTAKYSRVAPFNIMYSARSDRSLEPICWNCESYTWMWNPSFPEKYVCIFFSGKVKKNKKSYCILPKISAE